MTDVAALAAWTEANRSAARSYYAYPTVTGQRETPACANDCGRGTRGRGQVCSACRKAEKRHPMSPSRRRPHTPAGPVISNRRDEPPPPPCAVDDEHGNPNWVKFDRVLDHGKGGPQRLAVAAAVAVCDTCPLATKAACLRDNQDNLGVIAGLTYRERVPWLPPTALASCGKEWGPTFHRRNGEYPCDPCKAAKAAGRKRQRTNLEARLDGYRQTREARLEDLRELIGDGAPMGEVLDRLGMTRRALWKWCDRNGHMVEWVRLSPPVPAAIGLRARHNKGRAAV